MRFLNPYRKFHKTLKILRYKHNNINIDSVYVIATQK